MPIGIFGLRLLGFASLDSCRLAGHADACVALHIALLRSCDACAVFQMPRGLTLLLLLCTSSTAGGPAAGTTTAAAPPRPPRHQAPPREPTRQQTLHGRVLHLRVAAFFLRIGGANLTLLVDAQASASDATTAHKQAASSLFIPVSTSAQLATAAVVPRIPGAAAASELPAMDLHLVQTDPRTAHLPASMASAVATCSHER